MKKSPEIELRKVQAELASLLANKVYLGGAEQDRAYALYKRVSALIDAEPAALLLREAKTFLNIFAPQVAKSKERLRERQAEAAKLGEEQLAARKRREAEVAENLKEQEARRLAQLEAMRQLG